MSLQSDGTLAPTPINLPLRDAGEVTLWDLPGQGTKDGLADSDMQVKQPDMQPPAKLRIFRVPVQLAPTFASKALVFGWRRPSPPRRTYATWV